MVGPSGVLANLIKLLFSVEVKIIIWEILYIPAAFKYYLILIFSPSYNLIAVYGCITSLIFFNTSFNGRLIYPLLMMKVLGVEPAISLSSSSSL
jgi:hypothetical protein